MRFQKILNKAFAENVTCLSKKTGESPLSSISVFPITHPLFAARKIKKLVKKIIDVIFFQEELENNPMKLLEERTEASKNEMDRMEALEELQELNKRTVKVDYDTMLSRYDKIRAKEAEKKEEVSFVKRMRNLKESV